MEKYIKITEAANFYGVTSDTIRKVIARHNLKIKILPAEAGHMGRKKVIHVNARDLNLHLTNARIHGRIYT